MNHAMIVLGWAGLCAGCLANSLSVPRPTITGAQIETEASAKRVAFGSYIRERNGSISATETVRDVRALVLGFDMDGFATNGAKIWEARVFDREALRALIWINPYTSQVRFLCGVSTNKAGVTVAAEQNRRPKTESKSEGIWGPPTNGLQLSLSLNKTNYSAGEEIWAKMLLRNVGSTAKKVEQTLQITDFMFTILDPDNKPARLTPFGERLKNEPVMMWDSIRTLKPGDEMGDEHRLNHIWDMSRPGKYRITAVRPVSLDNWMELKAKGVPFRERSAYVTSNPVEVEVGAK